jgi:hypothetical protein
MKQVIVFEGPKNSGKTDAIRKTYEELLSTLRAGQVNARIVGKLKPKETHIVITIDEVRIGITSAGDTPQEVKNRLRLLELAGCTVIVCASRNDSPGCTDAVDNLMNSGFEIERVSKEKEPEGATQDEIEAANQQAAHEVALRILQLLGK